jgi:hypothetical protein
VQLDPAFSPHVHEYTASVSRKISRLEVTAEPTSTRSKALTIDGQNATPRGPTTIVLKGKSPALVVHVESPDGTESSDYKVSIVR